MELNLLRIMLVVVYCAVVFAGFFYKKNYKNKLPYLLQIQFQIFNNSELAQKLQELALNDYLYYLIGSKRRFYVIVQRLHTDLDKIGKRRLF